MNELDMLKIINNKLSVTNFLGNDCAEISTLNGNLPFFVTHDTLVEEVHFTTKTISPKQLAKKSIAVNISDLCASLAEPKFLTISLSLPEDVSSDFVAEFYEGVEEACFEYGCVVAGGDLTRSEKIVVSICAIGQQKNKVLIGRQNAKVGDCVMICGYSGASSVGLFELMKNEKAKSSFTDAHLNPVPKLLAVNEILSQDIDRVASMDTSDGLADALYKIAEASGVDILVNGENIPTMTGFEEFCSKNALAREETILFGAEDFSLLISVDEKIAQNLSKDLFVHIGNVTNKSVKPQVQVNFENAQFTLTEDLIKEKTFHHFKENNEGKNDI